MGESESGTHAAQPVRAGDIGVAVLLYVVALGLAVLAYCGLVIVSIATIECGPHHCNPGMIDLGWGIPIVSSVAALIGSAAMMFRAARRRTIAWIWPLAAIAIIVATFFLGAYLIDSGVPPPEWKK
ncbi:hypothetical protein [Nocardia sp. NPDC052566]|uniref:hypothetical protein n=1 Tax=Nocardia sp. NPDC052566 TaxID=3364330 RepID=UPI0037CB1831